MCALPQVHSSKKPQPKMSYARKKPQPARPVASTLNYYAVISEGGSSIHSPIPPGGRPAALDFKKITRTGVSFTSKTPAAELKRMFNYDGTPIVFTELAQGSEGRVLSGRAGSVSFAVKMQECDDEAISGIRKADALADCDLVSFRAFQNTYPMPVMTKRGLKFTESSDLVTFMDKMDADCGSLKFSGNTPKDIADRVAFVAFMDTLLACLKIHAVTYPDMKPQNVGYTRNPDQTIQFRLIDLDGLNGTVATYPATTALAVVDSRFYNRDLMALQTAYAFEITKLLVFGHSWGPFIHTSEVLDAGNTEQVLRNIINDRRSLAEVQIAATEALRLLREIKAHYQSSRAR